MSSRGQIRVEVLGPLRVLDADGADVTPAGRLLRRLLAALILGRGQVLSIDRGIEVLWPVDRPADPVGALQNHVSRLRSLFPPGAIESVGDGYRLDPTVLDVDETRLDAVLNAPSPDGPQVTAVESVLARWNGPAYPELADVDDARAGVRRLDELRVRAREVVAEWKLAAGETDGLAAELSALARDHPLREQPRALLIEVLAATGRHADALRAFDDFRRLLGDELGIEPSPALMDRHAELLVGAGLSGWSPHHRLPVPTTSLLGREELLDELVTLGKSARLVTLVGPGGVGKTRVVLELGHRLTAAPSDGPVVFCDLSRAEATSAVDMVADALRIDGRPGTPTLERISGVIGQADGTLLLDNCEHVLDPIAELVQHLLSRCPNLRLLATSRERLRLPGEQVRSIPPLAVGDVSSPAVRLFIERAQDVAQVPLGPETLERVGWIVAELDGLPLAIELAAARMHTHDVEEISAGIESRFDFLSTGFRISERHASLSAAVSWSFQLLDDDLRKTFAELSVPGGSFDVATAAAVNGVDHAVAADRLARLVERSLVLRTPDRRYRLLETLRAYGAEQLQRAGRVDEIRARHAHHMVAWLGEARRQLARPGTGAIDQIDQAVPELRRALDWLLGNDVVAAGRLVSSVLDYGFLRLRPDVLAWAERVTVADPGDASPFASEVWAIAAYSAWMAGDIGETGRRAARALRLARTSDEPIPGVVLAARGAYELFDGRLSESAEWYRKSSDAAARDGSVFYPIPAGTEVMVAGYAHEPGVRRRAEQLVAEMGREVTPFAAYVWYCAGEAELAADLHRARAHFERALEIAAVTNAAFVTGVAGASKASIDVRLGDWDRAADDYQKLIWHWRRAGMWSTQWTMLRWIAILLENLGRRHESAVLEGALRATAAGHRLFGADAVAMAELADRLRETLGAESHEAARQQGAALSDDALLEFAQRAL